MDDSNAIDEVIAAGGPDVVAKLLTLLDGATPEQRVAVVEALAMLEHNDVGNAAGPRVVALLDDEDELVRNAAADALGVIGYAAAADRLRERLANDASALVRASSAESLGDLGGGGATCAALHAALGDEDAAVRGYAANSIGLVGGEDDLPLLAAALAKETTAEVRGELLGARYRLGVPAALELLLTMLSDADDLLSINLLNVFDDLASRKFPPTLATDAPRIAAALGAQAQRFVSLRGQTDAILARLARGS